MAPRVQSAPEEDAVMIPDNVEIKDNDSEPQIYDTKKEPKYMARVRRWEKKMGFQTPLIWLNIFFITSWHLILVAWFGYNLLNKKFYKWQSLVFVYATGVTAGLGITAGAHRLWSHRSYKAKWPLKMFLLLCYSIAGENSLYDWVRDHRVHHKYSETSADPHDSNRGFFFAHVGWLMMKKHPEVRRKGAAVDMSDIVNDPLLTFYNRYFIWFKLIFCFVLPIVMGPLLWDETWTNSILLQGFFRYLFVVNASWCVNSVAHIWGNRPYDQNIKPVENLAIAVYALGEGWHNYHHTFPWDYKAAELGHYVNFTTQFLDFCAKVGWAYDMKEASPTLVKTVAEKRGENKCH